MNAAYQHLALADVRPGMVLSDELLDQQGKVLLPQGAILSAAIIALLPGHGVDRLAVLCGDTADGTPAPRPGPAPGTDPAAQQARLAQLFRHSGAKAEAEAGEDSASALLRRYIEHHRLDRQSAP